MDINAFKSISEDQLIDSLVVENQETVKGGSWWRVIGILLGGAGLTELNAPGVEYDIEIGDCTCNTEGCK